MMNKKRPYIPDMEGGFNPGQLLTPEMDMIQRMNLGDIKRRKVRSGKVIPYRQDPAKGYNNQVFASQSDVGKWILDVPNAKLE